MPRPFGLRRKQQRGSRLKREQTLAKTRRADPQCPCQLQATPLNAKAAPSL